MSSAGYRNGDGEESGVRGGCRGEARVSSIFTTQRLCLMVYIHMFSLPCFPVHFALLILVIRSSHHDYSEVREDRIHKELTK